MLAQIWRARGSSPGRVVIGTGAVLRAAGEGGGHDGGAAVAAEAHLVHGLDAHVVVVPGQQVALHTHGATHGLLGVLPGPFVRPGGVVHPPLWP